MCGLKNSQIQFLRVYIEVNEVHTERGNGVKLMNHRSWLCIQKVEGNENGLESIFQVLEFLNYIVENI